LGERSEHGMKTWTLAALAGLVMECAAAIIALIAAAGGHGTYTLAKILFPYSLALTALTGSITAPLIVLALVQYPLYACGPVVADDPDVRWRTGAMIVGAHVAAVVAAFVWADPAFSP
jgi:hypothetical protein